METVSPNIFVSDLQVTIDYYQKLDFQIVTSVPDPDSYRDDRESGKMIFVLMMNGTTTFMFQTFRSIENQLPSISRSNGGSLLLYIRMKGIRAFFERIKEKVKILSGLEKTFYGATEFSVIDPNNFVLTFAEDD